MSATVVTAFIAVFRGEPFDYQDTRRAMLWFKFADGSSPAVVRVTGQTRDHHVEVQDGYDPSESRSIAGIVELGRLLKPASKLQIVHLVRHVPVDNESLGFNSQMWVGNALAQLKDEEYLTSQDCQDGIDRMLDLTLEAKDE